MKKINIGLLVITLVCMVLAITTFAMNSTKSIYATNDDQKLRSVFSIDAGRKYFSEEQLTKDRLVAERENIQIDTVHADMTKLFPFEDESFDIIFCPVSNAYISDLENMWKESYRVLKKGGLLMVGYMNPWIYMYDGDDVWDFTDKELLLKYSLPYDSSELEKQGKIEINPEYGYEFSHTLESQIGGQLKVGFAMIDFYESKDNRNRLSKYGSDYLANLCIKL